MALNSYSGLSTSLNSWNERSYTQAQIDDFMAIFEASANRKLRQDFRRRSSGTLVTDSTGLATLPTGFVGMSALTRDVLGSLPLTQVSWGALADRNPYELASDSEVYAINGTSLMVSPVVEDSFNIAYSAVLAGLSATNTTNWLLALAPDAYLFGCKAAAYAFEEDMNNAGIFGAQAMAILDELVSQGNVAEYGNAEMTFSTVAP